MMETETEAVNQIDSEDNNTDEDCEVNNLTLKKLQEDLNLAENFESFFLNVNLSAKEAENSNMSCKIVYLHTVKSTMIF